MKCIEDTVQEIDELIIREEEDLSDLKRDGRGDSIGAANARGALEVLRELRLWVFS